MTTKKIIIEKEEGVGEVIDRILKEPDRTLIVVVPRGSMLGKSARDFNLIKRESANAGKDISVESVDENILAFAKNAGLTVNHPLLRERGALGMSGISDIIPITRESGGGEGDKEIDETRSNDETSEPSHGRKRTVAPRKMVVPMRKTSKEVTEESEGEEVDHEEGVASEDMQQEEKSFFKEEDRFFKKRQIPITNEASDDEEERTLHHYAVTGKQIGWTVAVLVVLAAALYGITVVFGLAKINITFKKTPWSYNGNFVALTSVSQINAANNIIPAQIFSVTKNTTQSFRASGKQYVSLKAQGTITIYNSYSSSPQTLVAATRFVTPDGIMFRLVNEVVVPGAAVTNGQIVPSSITALIIASSSGPDYNVGPTPKLSIPGFVGTPKYNAFYGAIASGTSGGFIGEKAVPTANDIATAEQNVTNILTSDLQNSLIGSYTNNFEIIDGATTSQITKLSVNTSTDENGEFSVFGEGTLSAIGFDETIFKTFLLSLAQSTEASSTFGDLTLDYASAIPDFANGKLSFSVSAQGSLEPAFSADAFRGSVAGEKISDAKDAISSLPELQEGAISVWPAWLWQIPSDTNKIQITVN